MRSTLTATGILTLLPSPVGAHLVNTSVDPFYAGMLHPLMSTEHLLPMLALVLLLAAVSIQRTGFGMLLVLAFSLGLAGVLTTVGLLFVKGRRLLRRTPGTTAMARYIPAASAVVITIIGLVITGGAIAQILS